MTIALSAADSLPLPDPLTTSTGKKVTTPAEWRETRRAEILELFRANVYGRAPSDTGELTFDVFDKISDALGGTAIRKQVAINIATAKGTLRVDLLLYLPRSAEQQPVPVLTLLNFHGNHTVNADRSIAIPKNIQQKLGKNASAPTNPEEARGMSSSRFPVQEIIRRGYGLVTAFYGDIDPDFHDCFKNGIHPLFERPGERPPDAWAAVSAWSWGLSRIMDYLETDRYVDYSKVAVLGHSRLGKTALWAGAQDERFGIVISNDSGSTGAALARHKKGETVAAINNSFPHWFCDNYKVYNNREDELPVDQHMLLSLIAPRPVYIASATEDLWADPHNEFLSAVHAEPVYRLFGLDGLSAKTMPPPDQPISHGYIAYHVRTGKHGLTPYDWACYMDYADKHWKKSQQGAAPDAGNRRR
jgi:hypothetical protein